jgi:biotin/methionine sulfoxide reductase
MRYTAAHWGAYVIEGDRLRPVDDDPHPSRIGKGWVSAARNAQSRILRPAIRRGWLAGDKGAGRADDGYVEVSWDRAAALAARELDRVRTRWGNGAIYAGSYGWASAGRFHHAQSQLRRFMNLAGGCVTSRNTYSFAAAEVLLPLVTGLEIGELENRATSWPLIAEHCELLVAFGGISGRTAQITSSGTTTHEVEGWLARLHARLVNVSPCAGDLPGAEHLPIRPGTDAALMLALCHTLLAEGLHDEAFLSRHTSGWGRFRDYLQGARGAATSADWAEPICDIPAPAIRALARDMAAKRTMISVAWGLQRGDHGEQPLWAGLALAAMLGQIGRPGTGFGFGYGSTTPVGRPARLLRWPSVPQGRNPVEEFSRSPVSRTCCCPPAGPIPTRAGRGPIRTSASSGGPAAIRSITTRTSTA